MTSVSTSLTNAFKRRTQLEQPTWLIVLGILTVTIYAFSRTGFPEVARVSATIAFFTGFWGLYKYGSEVNSHILLRFVWIAAFFQFISWGLSQYVTPEWAEDIPKLDKVTRWFIFIPFAWWIAQRKNAIWLLWGAATAGTLISPWVTGGGLHEIIQGINGKRIDFGIRNAQHTALYFGTILIGICCLVKPLYRKNKLSLIPVALMISYCLLVIYINESRQAWLALIITFLVISSYTTLKYIKKSPRPKQIITIVLFFIGLTTLSTILITNDKIVNRVMLEQKTMNAVLSLEFDKAPYSSFGVRLHSWVAATYFIKAKPIFGWGHNGKSMVMEHTKTFPKWLKGFGHLHNFYIEMLVNYGIVGLIFYLSIWFVVGRMLFKEIKSGKVEKEIGYLFVAILFFWGVMNCFESYQNFWTGVFYFNVFMAGIMAKIWRAKLRPTTL
ncbi:O-antigen ligase family protein [Marinomonas primoryensis]|uniref:O-antigen ligase n=1 Tax=Marinomonas primoryensis TaxID=178399 RepID=A0A859CZC3_9GAMM|nr:O-antigen ligase family protein [Marinomonas primoryensis]QKK81948.1 O-antigen ligase [Marinomonas primoryensis]